MEMIFMVDDKKPPKRDKATIRPYVGANMIEGVRARFPDMDFMTDREFIEWALANLVTPAVRPVISPINNNSPQEANPTNVRATTPTTDFDRSAPAMFDPLSSEFD
jgi:hypothetical protein